jgi:hypothetical protein
MIGFYAVFSPLSLSVKIAMIIDGTFDGWRRDGDVKWGAFLQSLNTCFINITDNP